MPHRAHSMGLEGRVWCAVVSAVSILGGVFVLFPTVVAAPEFVPRTPVYARAGAGSAVVDGILYLLGGAVCDPYESSCSDHDYLGSATVEAYDPAANTWGTKSSMMEGRTFLSAAYFADKIFVFGGIAVQVPSPDPVTPLASVESYDVLTDRWEQQSPMLTPRWSASAAAVGDRIYVIGGYSIDDDQASGAVEAYDPETDIWEVKSPMPMPRAGAAIAVLDGRIYVMGGRNNHTVYDTVQVYDTSTDAWSAVSPMLAARERGGAAVAGGRVFAIGGMTPMSDYSPTDGSVEEYDPDENVWIARARMPNGRVDFAGQEAGGLIYAIGGAPFGPIVNTVDVYDPAADRWIDADIAEFELSVSPPSLTVRQGEHASTTISVRIPSNGPYRATQVDAGGFGACAVLDNGALNCWGTNTGSYPSPRSNIPAVTTEAFGVQVPSGMSGVTSVSVGGQHSCAVLAPGIVKCWGNNTYGQLGNGMTNSTDSQYASSTPTPVLVKGLTDAISVSAGRRHTCVLKQGGTVACWGSNTQGQLGNGTTADSYSPAAVPGLAGVRSVRAGNNHTCALLMDGAVACWGENDEGELGDGTKTQSTSPVLVAGITNAVSVDVGINSVCAVVAGGTVQCWGLWRNTGDGSGSVVPETVNGVSHAVQVSVGDMEYGSYFLDHTCVLEESGQLKCWGKNNYGQLGDGTTVDSAMPVLVQGISNAVGVSTGYYHSCALLADGSSKCWGDNRFGQTGDGSGEFVNYVPETVVGLSDVRSISAGYERACAVLADGTVKCWGKGPLGDGTDIDRSTPVTVSGIMNAVVVEVPKYYNQGAPVCAVLADGTVKCWGGDDLPYPLRLTPQPFNFSNNDLDWDSATNDMRQPFITAVAVGNRGNICGLLSDGTVRCISGGYYNTEGFPVPGLDDARSVRANGSHVCVLRGSGLVSCYLNKLTSGGGFQEINIDGLSGIAFIASGGVASDELCAVLADGTVGCWNFTSKTFELVSGFENTVAVAAAYGYTSNLCALLASGSVVCKGATLGDGTGMESVVPVKVSGLSKATSIDAGVFNLCALDAEGIVKCWGSGYQGQLGNGAPIYHLSPVPVSDFSNMNVRLDAFFGGHCDSTACYDDRTGASFSFNVLPDYGCSRNCDVSLIIKSGSGTPPGTYPVNLIASGLPGVGDGVLYENEFFVTVLASEPPLQDFRPDLSVLSLTAPPSGGLSAHAVFGPVQVSVRNGGAADAPPFSLAFYLSPDPTITPDDIHIGTEPVSEGLPQGQSIARQISFEGLPVNELPPGWYYLGAIVDDQNVVDESSESNNIRATGQPIVLRIPEPTPPLLIDPSVNAGLLTIGTYAFRWQNTNPEPTDHQVRFFANNTCAGSPIAVYTTTNKESELMLSPPQSVGAYSWHVVALGEVGTSLPSACRPFDVFTFTPPPDDGGGGGGTPPPPPPPPPPPLPTEQELIVNGGFESGMTGWTPFGNIFADSRFSYPHSGTGYAYVSQQNGSPGNNISGFMYQTVTIPSSATEATLSFWYNITSQEFDALADDILNVTIQNASGQFLTAIITRSDLHKDPSPGNPYYHQVTFPLDVNAYKGQTIRINFLATVDDNGFSTVFRIDDVSLKVISGQSGNPPITPVNLQSGALLNTALLQWGDVANETGFTIERKTGSGSYGTRATVGANVVTYQDQGLSYGVQHCYRVRAYNASGSSNPSNEACATPIPAPQLVLPADGTNFIQGTLSVLLQWNAVSGAIGYGVDVGTGTCGATDVASQAALQASSVVSGLTNGKTYYWRVKSLGPAGSNALSPSGCFTFSVGSTTPPPPPPPQPIPSVQVVSPAHNATVTTDDVIIEFAVQDWIVDGKGENHIHFHVDGSADHLMFYNTGPSSGTVELNEVPTDKAAWIAPNKIQINNLSNGFHTIRAHLARPDHTPPGNPEAEDTVSFNVNAQAFPPPGTGPPVVLVVPGINFKQSLFPGDLFRPSEDPEYLSRALKAFLVDNQATTNAEITNFSDWRDRDIESSDGALIALQNRIREESFHARQQGSKFSIIAHSWGSVLAYAALAQEADFTPIQVEHFITMGSPLGYMEAFPENETACPDDPNVGFDYLLELLGYSAIQKFLDIIGARDFAEFMNIMCRLAPDSIRGQSISNPGGGIKSWTNHWSPGDIISQPIVLVNTINKKYSPDESPDSVRDIPSIIRSHAQYYQWDSNNIEVRGNAVRVMRDIVKQVLGIEIKKTPVILVPGIMGSYLERDYSLKDQIWVPGAIELQNIDQYIAEMSSDETGTPTHRMRVADIVRNAYGVIDTFQSLITELVNEEKYIEDAAWSADDDISNLFVFPYDWRLDIREAAQSLHEKIELVRAQTGSNKVDVVAHSMGGLVTKWYLQQGNNDTVRKLIFVGTPHDGAPEALKRIMFGSDMLAPLPLTNNDDSMRIIKGIAHNYPSAYQLLPNDQYIGRHGFYFNDYFDMDNNDKKGRLSYSETMEFLTRVGKNTHAREWNDAVHESTNAWHGNGIQQVINIVGCGKPTVGTIIAHHQKDNDEVAYWLVNTSGDETVPLGSAKGVDAETTYYVRGGSHARLPSADGVRQLISDVLKYENFPLFLSGSNISTNGSDAFCALPPGTSLTINSPLELHIYDSQGRHTGLTPEGYLEKGIPDVAYDIIENNKFAFLPDGETYTIVGKATGLGSFDMRVQSIESEVATQTALFDDVPLPSLDTEIRMEITPGQMAYALQIDQNGDEVFEVEEAPSAILDAEQSHDLTSPETSISLAGSVWSEGKYNSAVTVTLTASDDNAGVLKTEYSLDGGDHWSLYNGSFVLGENGTTTIHYLSTDRAGNEELVKTKEVKINMAPGVTIEGGAQYATSSRVHLDLHYPAGVKKMRISSRPLSAGSRLPFWQEVKPEAEWFLAGMGGEQTVYVQYQEEDGTVLPTVNDTIILDLWPPTGRVRITDPDRTYPNVVLDLSASDRGSGVTDMMVSNRRDFIDAVWQPYQESLPWVIDGSSVYAKFRDAAGNVSIPTFDLFMPRTSLFR